MMSITNNLQGIYDGHPFRVTLQEIPSLVGSLYEKASKFSRESNLEPPPLTERLVEEIKIFSTDLTHLFETEKTSEILCTGLIKSLIKILLILGKALSLWCAQPLFYVCFLCIEDFLLLKEVSLISRRLDRQAQAIELTSAQQNFPFFNILNNRPSSYKIILALFLGLFLGLFYIYVPIAPLIESFCHNYIIKKIRRIQKQNIVEQLMPQFEYYIMKYRDLDEVLSGKKRELQDNQSVEILDQLQKKLQAMHKFYTRTLEPSRKKIAEEIDATDLFPTDLSPMMAQYI